MPIRPFCDICGREIKEAAKGEGRDAGRLVLDYGICSPKTHKMVHHTEVAFALGTLCRECYDELRKAILNCKNQITLRMKGVSECPVCRAPVDEEGHHL